MSFALHVDMHHLVIRPPFQTEDVEAYYRLNFFVVEGDKLQHLQK